MNPFAKAIQEEQHESPYDLRRSGAAGRPSKQKYPYSYHADAFITFQPWTECPVCKKRWTDEKSLPVEGTSYQCPHVRLKEYLELRNRMLQRELLEVACRTEILKTGVVLTYVEWAEPIERSKPAAAKKGPPRL